MKGSNYDPFKTDVFALAASLLHMVTLTSPEDLITSDRVNEDVVREVAALPCSKQLQTLLIKMLAYEEGHRPTMQEVYSTISEESLSLPDVLASVCYDQVELFDLKSQQSSKNSLPVNFEDGGSFIQIDRHTLLCLGANPASTSVYALGLPSLQLTSLQPLRTPRAAAGVATAADFMYVFGGVNLKSCEKYRVAAGQCLPLGSMREERCHFTPCTFQSLIYLPCPRTTLCIETFSPEAEAFHVLPVFLPSQMLEIDSISFVANGELCILTDNKQMGRWKIQSEREFSCTTTTKMCWSTQSPVIFNSFVLILSYGRVVKFSLESYTFT
jgi:hypothetical protein